MNLKKLILKEADKLKVPKEKYKVANNKGFVQKMNSTHDYGGRKWRVL